MASYNVGDLVWAKMKGHPAWPAQVVSASDVGVAVPSGKLPVVFYGTRELATLWPNELFAYLAHRAKFEMPRKLRHFNLAVHQIRREAGLDAEELSKFPAASPASAASRQSTTEMPSSTAAESTDALTLRVVESPEPRDAPAADTRTPAAASSATAAAKSAKASGQASRKRAQKASAAVATPESSGRAAAAGSASDGDAALGQTPGSSSRGRARKPKHLGDGFVATFVPRKGSTPRPRRAAADSPPVEVGPAAAADVKDEQQPPVVAMTEPEATAAPPVADEAVAPECTPQRRGDAGGGDSDDDCSPLPWADDCISSGADTSADSPVAVAAQSPVAAASPPADDAPPTSPPPRVDSSPPKSVGDRLEVDEEEVAQVDDGEAAADDDASAACPLVEPKVTPLRISRRAHKPTTFFDEMPVKESPGSTSSKSSTGPKKRTPVAVKVEDKPPYALPQTSEFRVLLTPMDEDSSPTTSSSDVPVVAASEVTKRAPKRAAKVSPVESTVTKAPKREVASSLVDHMLQQNRDQLLQTKKARRSDPAEQPAVDDNDDDDCKAPSECYKCEAAVEPTPVKYKGGRLRYRCSRYGCRTWLTYAVPLVTGRPLSSHSKRVKSWASPDDPSLTRTRLPSLSEMTEAQRAKRAPKPNLRLLPLTADSTTAPPAKKKKKQSKKTSAGADDDEEIDVDGDTPVRDEVKLAEVAADGGKKKAGKSSEKVKSVEKGAAQPDLANLQAPQIRCSECGQSRYSLQAYKKDQKRFRCRVPECKKWMHFPEAELRRRELVKRFKNEVQSDLEAIRRPAATPKGAVKLVAHKSSKLKIKLHSAKHKVSDCDNARTEGGTLQARQGGAASLKSPPTKRTPSVGSTHANGAVAAAETSGGGGGRASPELTARQLAFVPSYVEGKSRWWLNGQNQQRNRSPSPPRRLVPSPLDAAAAFHLTARSFDILGQRLRPPRGRVSRDLQDDDHMEGTGAGTVDLLLDSLLASLAPLLSLMRYVRPAEAPLVDSDALADAIGATAIFTPYFN